MSRNVLHLNSLIVEERVNSCVASVIVGFIHFYPEASPVQRHIPVSTFLSTHFIQKLKIVPVCAVMGRNIY